MNAAAFPQKTCSVCKGSGKEFDSRKMGELLRAQREKAGLSLRKVADAIKISFAYLADLENGNRPLSLDRIKQIDTAIKKLCKS